MSSCEPLSLDWLDEVLSASHSVDRRSMNRATVQGGRCLLARIRIIIEMYDNHTAKKKKTQRLGLINPKLFIVFSFFI